MLNSLRSKLSEHKWQTLLFVNLGTFMAPLDTGIVALVLPNIARDFQTGIGIAIWVPVIYLMILTAFMTSFGRFSDIKGRKKYFNIGLVIFILGSAFSGMSGSIAELLIFRIVQAVGATLLLVNSRALIVDAFPKSERGLAMGIHVTVIYIAIAAGPGLGAIITEYIGWRNVFFINIPLGLLVLPYSYSRLSESKKSSNTSMDWVGSLIFAVALSTLLIALTFGPGENWTSIDAYIESIYLPLFSIFIWARTYLSIPILPLVGSSILLFILLSVWEIKNKNPIIDLTMLKNNRIFLSSNLSALLFYTSHFSTMTLLSFYLQLIRLMDPTEAAFVLSAFPLSVVIASPFVGRLSDRIGSRELTSLGLLSVSISLLLLSRLSPYSSIFFIDSTLIIMGVGVALFAAPNTNANLSSVGPDQRSLANGMLGTMRHMGQGLSLALAAGIVGIFLSADIYEVGGHISVVEYVNGLSQAFMIGSIIAMIGIVIVIFRGSNKN